MPTTLIKAVTPEISRTRLTGPSVQIELAGQGNRPQPAVKEIAVRKAAGRNKGENARCEPRQPSSRGPPAFSRGIPLADGVSDIITNVTNLEEARRA